MPYHLTNEQLRKIVEDLSKRVAALEANAITSVNGKTPDRIGKVSLGLEELSDVQITSKNPGDLIVWDDGLQAYVT